jgi:hypothetical protein
MNNNSNTKDDRYDEHASEALDNNYNKHIKRFNKLIVEGRIDRDFFIGLKNKHNLRFECDTIDYANKQEQNAMLGYGYEKNESDIMITRPSLINRIVSHPEECGLVDKDFDNDILLDRIFCTDTHDLETLLLLKDKDLLYKVFEHNNILIPSEILKSVVKKAKYLAYQVGIIKKAVHNIPGLYIPNTLPLDYEKFTTEDDEVILEKFCQFVRNKCKNCRINEKALINDEVINMFFNYYPNLGSVFDRDIDVICDISQTSDFWDIVNGHDLCELLCFSNDEIKKAFYKLHPVDNRRIKIFEDNIIQEFSTKYFKSTNLYYKMATAKLLEY